jgi:hypothetical protein
MPTAARLIAAIFLGLTGLVLAFQMRGAAISADNLVLPNFIEITAVFIGLTTGWLVVGPRSGRGWQFAASTGITGGIVLVVGLFLSIGTHEMLRRTLRNQYDTAIEALLAIFDIALKDLFALSTPGVLLPLIAGAIMTGFASEVASRNWK